jgi:hypothetical protein
MNWMIRFPANSNSYFRIGVQTELASLVKDSSECCMFEEGKGFLLLSCLLDAVYLQELVQSRAILMEKAMNSVIGFGGQRKASWVCPSAEDHPR